MKHTEIRTILLLIATFGVVVTSAAMPINQVWAQTTTATSTRSAVAQPATSTARSAAAATSTAQTPRADAQAQNSEQFVPLTSLPGLDQIAQAGNADGLANFLNQLYRLLIGAAAIIAVIQIMRAGFEFMKGSSSWQANKKAKDLIKNAVFGLLLVLSPVIVFGIINPDILRLELDFSRLQPAPSGQGAGASIPTGTATSTATSTPTTRQPGSPATDQPGNPRPQATEGISLAIYYPRTFERYDTRTQQWSSTTCYQQQVFRFTTMESCSAQRNLINQGTLFGSPQAGMVIVKSCVATPVNFTVQVPNDKPSCS